MYQRERANKRSVNDRGPIRLTASGCAAAAAALRRHGRVAAGQDLIAGCRGHRVHDRTRVLSV